MPRKTKQSATPKQTPASVFADSYSRADALLEIIREELGESVTNGDCHNATWGEAHYAQHVVDRLTAIAEAFFARDHGANAGTMLQLEVAKVRKERS